MSDQTLSRIVGATVVTQGKLVLRDRSTPFKILVILLLSLALVPSRDASYAVITVANHPLSMTADTALLSAAVVLCILVIALFGTAFGLHRTRDIELGVDRLIETQPASTSWIASGRVIANLAAGTTIASFAIMTLSGSLWWRYGAPPGAGSLLLSLSIVIAGFAFATVTGAAFDLFLPSSPSLRITLLGLVWTAAMIASISGSIDFVGLSLLRRMLPPQLPANALSLGFISANGISASAWPTLDGNVAAGVANRLSLIAGISILGVFLTSIRGSRLYSMGRKPLLIASDVRPVRRNRSVNASSRPPASPARPRLDRRRPAGVARTAMLLLGRLFGRSRFASLLIAIAFVVGITAPKPGTAAILLLLVPIFLFAPTEHSELRIVGSLEAVEPALQSPDPLALVVGAVTTVLLVASIPTLVRLPPPQAATLTIALASSALWIGWTHRVLGAPVLGVGIAGALIYVIGLNDVPPEADVLGIWHASLLALGLAVLLFSALCGGVVLHGWRRRALR